MLEKPEYDALKPDSKVQKIAEKRRKFGGRQKGTPNKTTTFKNLLEELDARGFDIYDEWVLAMRAKDYRRADTIAKLIPNTLLKQVQKTSSESDLAIQQYKINMESAKKSLAKALDQQKTSNSSAVKAKAGKSNLLEKTENERHAGTDNGTIGSGEEGSRAPLVADGGPENLHAENPETNLGGLPKD